jgi:hypothetical protein
MHAVRGALEWLGIWIAASVAVFAVLALWMVTQGAHGYRYAAALGAGIGLIAVIVYWALGARAVRWRVVRLLVAGQPCSFCSCSSATTCS